MKRGVCHRFLLTGLYCLLSLALAGCGPDYEPFDPDETRVFQVPIGDIGSDGDRTPCLFSVPTDYAPDRAWPLVVVLHGYGSSADWFHTLWRPVTMEKGFVLATPQGEDATSAGIGWSWGENSDEIIRRSIDGMGQLVHVDPSRVFLAGFSQGGRLTFTFGLEHAHVFRGLAPLGTPFHSAALPLETKTQFLKGTRVYIGRGELEPDLDRARAVADSLRTLGCDVRVEVYPGVGHALPDPMAEELARILDFLSTPQDR
jgi:predicted esterase